MDIVRENKLLLWELQTLLEEALKRSQRVQSEGDCEPRLVFAMAQVAGCRDLTQFLADNEDWLEFGEFLETTLENEELRYQEALENKDRKIMIVAMAHRRQMKRLARRLTDPRRRRMLLPQLDSPNCLTPWLQTQAKNLSLNQ